MISIFTKEDLYKYDLPEFVKHTAMYLLEAYDTDSLENFGGIYWIESEEELLPYLTKTVEFTEKILCEKKAVWHAVFPVNNDYCIDVYADEKLITDKILCDWKENLTRTVYDDEFQQ